MLVHNEFPSPFKKKYFLFCLFGGWFIKKEDKEEGLRENSLKSFDSTPRIGLENLWLKWKRLSHLCLFVCWAEMVEGPANRPASFSNWFTPCFHDENFVWIGQPLLFDIVFLNIFYEIKLGAEKRQTPLKTEAIWTAQPACYHFHELFCWRPIEPLEFRTNVFHDVRKGQQKDPIHLHAGKLT